MLSKARLLVWSAQGNTLVILLCVLNTLITLGIGGFVFFNYKKEKEKAVLEQLSAAANLEEEDDAEGSEGNHSSSEHSEKGSSGHNSEKGDKKKRTEYGKMVTLEQFTINLASATGTTLKYLRANITLEVLTTEAETELNAKIPQVRNIIIDLFNSKRPVDLVTADNREAIKEEIKNILNHILVNGKVVGVYFTNFAIAG